MRHSGIHRHNIADAEHTGCTALDRCAMHLSVRTLSRIDQRATGDQRCSSLLHDHHVVPMPVYLSSTARGANTDLDLVTAVIGQRRPGAAARLGLLGKRGNLSIQVLAGKHIGLAAALCKCWKACRENGRKNKCPLHQESPLTAWSRSAPNPCLRSPGSLRPCPSRICTPGCPSLRESTSPATLRHRDSQAPGGASPAEAPSGERHAHRPPHRNRDTPQNASCAYEPASCSTRCLRAVLLRP